jgi:hypothetical protein
VPTGKETAEWGIKLVQPQQILSDVIIDLDTGDIHRQEVIWPMYAPVRLVR